ncbi:MAG: thioesterase family protein [Ilumatobacter sp.]|uniref:thioesterase family protein n=1 Tax=Ilumatobacter sp. TaxID=1967498 RepID=UPI00391D17D5
MNVFNGVADFERETDLEPAGDGCWNTELSSAWNIGPNPNGGYAAAPVLRAMRQVAGGPDPVSVTTHFLRPAIADEPAGVTARLEKRGRSLTAVTGSLSQHGVTRVLSVAAFGDVSVDGPNRLSEPAPELPAPDDCVGRHGLEVGVDVALDKRIDVRLDPATSVAGSQPIAEIRGWVRFTDERAPDTLALPVFADAFPPAAYVHLEPVGWIPTVELTVHVRRRPVAGWIRARFTCNDLAGDRLVEDGILWDASGQVVARARQVAQILRT